MKTAIVYATMTKHSGKIAEAIGNKLGISPQNVAVGGNTGDADTLIIIGGIYAGKYKSELLEFVKNIDNAKVKRAAIVETSCTGEQRGIPSALTEVLRDKDIEVLGELKSQGSFLFVGKGHPNEADLAEAVDWAEDIIKQQESSR